jgi:tRNA 2-(methylsulfanyl)-N6-isopentenyladenosine37 hydroxylase
MLHLHSVTGPEWAPRAAEDIDTILLDHAHLEKKAASTALSFLFRYPEYPALMRPLSELAREELEHFELVLAHLERRGLSYGRLRASPYPGKLMSVVRSTEPDRVIDRLLVCAVIEARSCERMGLLAGALTAEPELAALYGGLLASEARHHMLYVDLAAGIRPREQVMARLAEICEHESAVLADAPEEPRLHN